MGFPSVNKRGFYFSLTLVPELCGGNPFPMEAELPFFCKADDIMDKTAETQEFTIIDFE